MKNYNENDKFFKELASLYAEKEGTELLADEAEKANDFSTESDIRIKQRIDSQIHEIKKKKALRKRRNIIFGALPLAACLLFVLTFGHQFILDLDNKSNTADMYSMKAVEESGADENAGDVEVFGSASDTETMQKIKTFDESETGEVLEESIDSAVGNAMPSASISLADNYDFVVASVPQNYMLEGIEEDNGKMVYRILSDKNNIVVVTSENVDSDYDITKRDDFELFSEMDLNGTPIFLNVSDDFNKLIFTYEGLLYELTNEFDSDELIVIAENMTMQNE